MPGTSRSLAPVLHAQAGRLYDRPGILDVRVIEPVILTASFTNIIIFLISYYFLIVSFSWRLELGAWSLELGALAAGRLFLFNFRLCRARSAASPVFQVILIF